MIRDTVVDYFRTLKTSYLAKKRKQFLASHGCYTEEAYARKFDEDTNQRATRIVDWYAGYPYVVVFVDPLGDIWTKYGDWLQGLAIIEEWCRENTVHCWRSDCHRVIRYGAIGLNNAATYEWHLNEIGGLDYMFFAFKDEADALWFKLKWGGE